MKKGQNYEGIIERVDFPNKGVAVITEEINGEQVKTAVTIKGTLPGQKVEFVLSKKRKGKCEGRLIRVIEKADSETQTPFVLILDCAEDVHTRLFPMRSNAD